MRHLREFALVAQMVSVGIIGILAALALAVLPRFVRLADLRAWSAEFLATLQEARSHALHR